MQKHIGRHFGDLLFVQRLDGEGGNEQRKENVGKQMLMLLPLQGLWERFGRLNDEVVGIVGRDFVALYDLHALYNRYGWPLDCNRDLPCCFVLGSRDRPALCFVDCRRRINVSLFVVPFLLY